VDTERFAFVDKPLGSPCYFGWVGNSDRAVKNYDKLLTPIRKHFKRNRNVRFDFVASSKKEATVPFGRMVEYYSKIDYLLVVSQAEGTPNPALEAMSCGVPVITTRVGNMPEIVEHGANGFFCGAKVDEFCGMMEYALKMPNYAELRRQARARIEPWDWKLKAPAWVNFILQ
jgi:glycosyltransferase involved in cell wall biosynthesis